MKIGNNGSLVLGPFDEFTPCLMIVLMNCQTKLRINHLTAVKSVAILEIEIYVLSSTQPPQKIVPQRKDVGNSNNILNAFVDPDAGQRAVLLARWIVRSLPLEIVGSSGPRRYPLAENWVWSDQEDHEEIGSKDRAASTGGPHSDSLNNTSRRRRSNCSTNNFQTPCKRAIFQQDNARTHTGRVAQDFLRHFQTLPWPIHSPDLSPVEHVWDQLKRQMPSCHSVHDLELAVQDLWAHLPQDNIRCLINSVPDRVTACIAAGGGPTRY
ncbi:transposable element Tcb2 transposase [Trichonephila clavipes]|nr:transposable element Tcb2 transposase [Trichonephila clavipes]